MSAGLKISFTGSLPSLMMGLACGGLMCIGAYQTTNDPKNVALSLGKHFGGKPYIKFFCRLHDLCQTSPVYFLFGMQTKQNFLIPIHVFQFNVPTILSNKFRMRTFRCLDLKRSMFFENVVYAATSAVLTGVMGYRFFNSGKFMPAGLVGTLRYIKIFFANFKKKFCEKTL